MAGDSNAAWYLAGDENGFAPVAVVVVWNCAGDEDAGNAVDGCELARDGEDAEEDDPTLWLWLVSCDADDDDDGMYIWCPDTVDG